MTDWNLGINVTMTGIVLVFAMLVLLVLILMAFGKISIIVTKSNDKKANKKREQILTAMAEDLPPSPSPVFTHSTPAVTGVSEEIVAAISAAIAVMYAGSSKKPVIKAIKPASASRRSAWAFAGIQNNTRTF